MLYQFLLYSKVNQLYVYVYPHFFWISFPFRSAQSIEQSSLSYTVGFHQLSILYIVSIVYICKSQSPNSSHPLTIPLGIHMFVLYVCVSISKEERILLVELNEMSTSKSYMQSSLKKEPLVATNSACQAVQKPVPLHPARPSQYRKPLLSGVPKCDSLLCRLLSKGLLGHVRPQ